jgi:hypothetical protein
MQLTLFIAMQQNQIKKKQKCRCHTTSAETERKLQFSFLEFVLQSSE